MSGRVGELPLWLSWYAPYGLMTPAAWVGLYARPYMERYGVTNADFGRIAVVDRAHAATNPDAWFYERPITLEDHQASRWIIEPVLRLLDCCQESDGGVALVVTSAERARDLRQPPAVITAAAQGATFDGEMMTSYYRDDLDRPAGDGRGRRPALAHVGPRRPPTSRPRSSTTTSRRSC